MKTINVRAMVEGAILASLTAMMGIFYNVPIVGVITMFWSVPIVIVGYRNGFRVSLIAAFIAAVLVSLVATPIVGLILFIAYALPGATMGYMIRKKISPYRTLVVCGLIISITIVLEFVLSLELMMGIGIIEILGNLKLTVANFNSMLNKEIAEISGMYSRFGFDETAIKKIINDFNILIKQVILLLPASLIASGISLSYVNFKAVKFILGRAGYKIEDVKRFSAWRIDSRYKYIVLGITFVLLLIMSQQVQFLIGFNANAWMLMMLFYAVLGLSVTVYYIEQISEKYEIAKPVQSLMIVFVFLFMMRVLPYIGMFDIAADIRRFSRNIPGGAK